MEKHDDHISSEQKVRNATAYVYWGAAFLVLILGFRAIMETLNLPEWWNAPITVLAMLSLVVEFTLLIFYGNTIRTARSAKEKTDVAATVLGDLAATLEQLKASAASFAEVTDVLKQSGSGFDEAVQSMAKSSTAAMQIATAVQQSAANLEARAAEMKSVTTDALDVMKKSTEQYEHSAVSLEDAADHIADAMEEARKLTTLSNDAQSQAVQLSRESADSLRTMLDEMKTTNRATREMLEQQQAGLKTTLEALQLTAASLQRPAESLANVTAELQKVASESYRQKALMDVLLGVDKTLERLKSESGDRKD